MQNIAFILDIEYYSCAKLGRPDYFFGYREVSLLRCDRVAIDPCVFFAPVWPGQIPLENPRIRASVNWERNLSRLDYSPDLKAPYIRHEEVKDFLRSRIGTLPTGSYVGYKGGTVERDLLFELGYDSINLEHLQCPKYEVILQMYPELNALSQRYNCGYHTYNRRRWWVARNGDPLVHCSAVEVYCFNYWLQRNL